MSDPNMTSMKLGLRVCLILAAICAVVALLSGCSGRRVSKTETTTNADGTSSVCTHYADGKLPAVVCEVK